MIDGIRVTTKKTPITVHVIADGKLVLRPHVFSYPPRIVVRTVKPRKLPQLRFPKIVRQAHPAWMAMSVVMVCSFFAGMVTVWQTQLSEADLEVESGRELGGLVTILDRNDVELTVIADLLPLLIEQNRHQPTPQEIASAERREKLRAYLASKKSPLATDDTALDAFLSSNNMEMMLAISFVEGNFCKHHVAHNCSGIGGSKMFKYKNFAEWIKDFDSLLERKYKGLKVEQFIGYYVVPGSENWKRGVYQVLDELKEQGIQ